MICFLTFILSFQKGLLGFQGPTVTGSLPILRLLVLNNFLFQNYLYVIINKYTPKDIISDLENWPPYADFVSFTLRIGRSHLENFYKFQVLSCALSSWAKETMKALHAQFRKQTDKLKFKNCENYYCIWLCFIYFAYKEITPREFGVLSLYVKYFPRTRESTILT